MVGAGRTASAGTAFAGRARGTGTWACREAWLRVTTVTTVTTARAAFADAVLDSGARTGSLIARDVPAGGVLARGAESRVAGHRARRARTAPAWATRAAAARDTDCGAATVRRATRRKCWPMDRTPGASSVLRGTSAPGWTWRGFTW